MATHDLLDKLSQLVTERKTFKDIMADGIVEDREVLEQAELVQKLMRRCEQELSPHDFELVSELIAEMAVLQVISQINNATI